MTEFEKFANQVFHALWLSHHQRPTVRFFDIGVSRVAVISGIHLDAYSLVSAWKRSGGVVYVQHGTRHVTSKVLVSDRYRYTEIWLPELDGVVVKSLDEDSILLERGSES